MKPHRKTILSILLPIFVCILINAQSQKFKGYPDPDPDVLSGFVNPPKGYGNIPFYWWNGDTLVKERLMEQLDILSLSATDGFAVSYIHTDPHVDTIANKNGHGLYGMTEAGVPKVFSKDWWDIWNWFSGECGKRGLGVGLDDYTVGWVGNGFYPDELDNMPLFDGHKGELSIKTDRVNGGQLFAADVPENLLSIVAWPGKIDLTNKVKDGSIKWYAPDGHNYNVYTITTLPGYVIHPQHGEKLTAVYFDRFESNMDEAGREGMNYFFQDELSYPIKMLSWSDDFQQEFLKRKGYDITPYLPALITYIGEITPKIRLDYCEVLMDLSEERYYQPIYDWHVERGLLYGCDNLSRGKDPVAYIDYFRAMSWFTAPGNDAPSRGSSFMETKVSSSIAHLYKRPRTWLEAFHSMGWGSSGEWLTQQIDHHFIAGGNLVCMHGLYYSTHGGWWEWAPPDFHFRMPYWPHMKEWLKYTERMSYLLSQGTHVCDIALMYPTESMQAYPDEKPDKTFDLAGRLSNNGLDFDFIDFRSLRNADISGKNIRIADEQYKIIVLSDMRALHHSSLKKILGFYRSGGIVLATGQLPEASSKSGEKDPEVDQIVKEIFGVSSADIKNGKIAVKQTNNAGGTGWYIADGTLEKLIPELIVPDFIPEKNEGKVLHRKIGNRDVYMVTDVDKDTECFFRSTGKVELWDANSGKIIDFPVIRQTNEGTHLKMNKDKSNSYLIVFSPGTPIIKKTTALSSGLLAEIPLDGAWEVELLPTLNNKWGDYRFPAFDGLIGAEARTFKYAPSRSTDTTWIKPGFDDSSWDEGIYGYGPQAETKISGQSGWLPVSFSWQYGVWDSPGAQGYHGLKGKVDDRFFILSNGASQEFKTYIYADHSGTYKIHSEGINPDRIIIDGKEVSGTVYLENGWHTLSAEYPYTDKVDYQLNTGAMHDDRKRGFVVIYPENTGIPGYQSPYAGNVSSRWDNSGQLMFDPYRGKHTEWNFRFLSAPGMKEMELTVYGELYRLWFDGNEIPGNLIQLTESAGKHNTYRIFLQETKAKTGVVAFSVRPEKGYQGTAAIKEPVKMVTGKGLLETGDWSGKGALLHYSGGMYYRKNCHITKAMSDKTCLLDLGKIVASCEVKVNNRFVGILMSPPYRFNISPYITEGENKIEVLVYSTLSNHYQTIPTPYRGDPKAGLIGPVSLRFCHNE